MKELHPNHYAMVFLGFAIGARPSTLRPLRRSGPNADIKWQRRELLLRRSHSLGREIMDQTKTGEDKCFPLPSAVIDVLKAHVDGLEGPMRESEYLFPSITGGLRARSVLDKPFQEVVDALGWTLHVTPRAMRRTFKDLARQSGATEFIVKEISGHATDQMHELYSTAQQAEISAAIGGVAELMTEPRDSATAK
jgi:integrase